MEMAGVIMCTLSPLTERERGSQLLEKYFNWFAVYETLKSRYSFYKTISGMETASVVSVLGYTFRDPGFCSLHYHIF
jgi:hypothetical protein